MRRLFIVLILVCIMSVITAFTPFSDNGYRFDINDLYDYERQFESEEIDVCSMSDVKTYMDYRMTTLRSSRQYQFLNYECTVDRKTGFMYDEDGFIAVALGSHYGEIGDRFYFTLDSGIVLPLVKGEEKADVDTDSTGCYHMIDGSVIEFVINDDYAYEFFGGGNGYPLNGNYNNYHLFRGGIVKVERVLDKKKDDIVTFKNNISEPKKWDIFHYGSGY